MCENKQNYMLKYGRNILMENFHANKNRKEEIGMKKMLLKLVALSALFVTACNVNLTCMYWVNQPEIPEKAKKLRKF